MLTEKLKRIKLVAMDVDGVLTDGSMIVGLEGDVKVFNVLDGLGISLARATGLEIAWISGTVSAAVARRAESLMVTELHQGVGCKRTALVETARKKGLTLEDVAYIGDDLNDLPSIQAAGVGFAVATAAPEVKDAADVVTERPGGKGAVREAIEMVLKAQGRWEKEVQVFLDKLRDEERNATDSGAIT